MRSCITRPTQGARQQVGTPSRIASCSPPSGSRPPARSLRFHSRKLDHLCPLLGFCGDEPPEVGGRARKQSAPKIGKPRFDLWVGKARIDLLVEPVEDFGWRTLWRT